MTSGASLAPAQALGGFGPRGRARGAYASAIDARRRARHETGAAEVDGARRRLAAAALRAHPGRAAPGKRPPAGASFRGGRARGLVWEQVDLPTLAASCAHR